MANDKRQGDVEVVGPMSEAAISRNARATGYASLPVRYAEYFAWVLRSARRLRRPVRCSHPNGAVVWVRLAASVSARVAAQR